MSAEANYSYTLTPSSYTENILEIKKDLDVIYRLESQIRADAEKDKKQLGKISYVAETKIHKSLANRVVFTAPPPKLTLLHSPNVAPDTSSPKGRCNTGSKTKDKIRAVIVGYLSVGVVYNDDDKKENFTPPLLKDIVREVNDLIKEKLDKNEVFTEKEVKSIRKLDSKVNRLWDEGDKLLSEHGNPFIRILHAIRKLFTWKVLIQSPYTSL